MFFLPRENEVPGYWQRVFGVVLREISVNSERDREIKALGINMFIHFTASAKRSIRSQWAI